MRSMGRLRVHPLVLNASAVILLRLGRLEAAGLRLNKLVEADERAWHPGGAAPLPAVIVQDSAPHDDEVEPDLAP